MRGKNAPTDEHGNQVWQQNGKWYAYAWSVFQTECIRGEGVTKEMAIMDSIDRTNRE